MPENEQMTDAEAAEIERMYDETKDTENYFMTNYIPQLLAERKRLQRELSVSREGDWDRLNKLLPERKPGGTVYIADASANEIERLRQELVEARNAILREGLERNKLSATIDRMRKVMKPFAASGGSPAATLNIDWHRIADALAETEPIEV